MGTFESAINTTSDEQVTCSVVSSSRSVGFSLQASDIALRDLYKLANIARSANASQQIRRMLDSKVIDANEVATLARKISDLRNLLRQTTQSQLTPVSRLISKILEKDRSWTQLVQKYGDPFNEALPSGQRIANAEKIIEKSAKSSDAMNALQLFGKALMVLSVAISAWQLGTGINKIQNGDTAEGSVDVAEGATGIGLTIGTYASIKSGALIVAEGTGTATFGAGFLAAGGLALGFEESRRAIRGEKTMAVEGAEYWADLVVQGQKDGGLTGFLEQAAGWTFGPFAALIAAGQGN